MRRAKAQRPLQKYLPRRAREEIGTADDFSYPLALVVHHDREVIGNGSVTSPDDEIARFDLAVLLVCALELVKELDGRLARVDGESKRVGPAGGRRPAAAGPWIDRFGLRIRRLCRSQRRSTAAARIAATNGLEGRNGFLVIVDSIGLEMNDSIPFEAKRRECFRNLACECRIATIPVEVIDPK